MAAAADASGEVRGDVAPIQMLCNNLKAQVRYGLRWHEGRADDDGGDARGGAAPPEPRTPAERAKTPGALRRSAPGSPAPSARLPPARPAPLGQERGRLRRPRRPGARGAARPRRGRGRAPGREQLRPNPARAPRGGDCPRAQAGRGRGQVRGLPAGRGAHRGARHTAELGQRVGEPAQQPRLRQPEEHGEGGAELLRGGDLEPVARRPAGAALAVQRCAARERAVPPRRAETLSIEAGPLTPAAPLPKESGADGCSCFELPSAFGSCPRLPSPPPPAPPHTVPLSLLSCLSRCHFL
ncbi:unnamed protein product [Prorocentrum cordatum]|uniref:Uncharacterized protein n=1 Tax=Prorocentrum cordatum TaxID=2364126 RepID=A0ABN9S8C2_9DINO|nr:unnamed protein product [Polarella glacialis]